MPKINIDSVPSDKAETARCRAIEDLIYIENNKDMYINQKKQLQNLVYKMYSLNFYIDHKSIFDTI